MSQQVHVPSNCLQGEYLKHGSILENSGYLPEGDYDVRSSTQHVVILGVSGSSKHIYHVDIEDFENFLDSMNVYAKEEMLKKDLPEDLVNVLTSRYPIFWEDLIHSRLTTDHVTSLKQSLNNKYIIILNQAKYSYSGCTPKIICSNNIQELVAKTEVVLSEAITSESSVSNISFFVSGKEGKIKVTVDLQVPSIDNTMK